MERKSEMQIATPEDFATFLTRERLPWEQMKISANLGTQELERFIAWIAHVISAPDFSHSLGQDICKVVVIENPRSLAEQVAEVILAVK